MKSYDKCGTDGAIVVVNSNRLANRYNQGIRNRIFFRDEEISTGDIVMVVKNNYFWLKDEEGASFIANGDIAEVRRIRRFEEMYGMRFAEMTLWFRDTELGTGGKGDARHTDDGYTVSLPGKIEGAVFCRAGR